MPRYQKGFPCAKRENSVSHWNEINFIRRGIIGKGNGIIKMIKEKNRSCVEIITELLSIIGWCHKIATFILIRHIKECLREKEFPGNEDERNEEENLALSLKKKLRPKKYAKKALKDSEYD